MSPVAPIHDPRLPPAAPPRGFALWALGFRPFYLLAAAFASVSIPLWIAQYAGVLPAAYLRSPTLHGHEMLFGYTMAVIAGFLFTAGRNWTAQPTPTGGLLVAYALLWIAGRVLVLTPWTTAAGVANAAFPLAVAAGLAVPLARSGNRRNYFFVALLAFLGLAAAALHLSLAGALAWPEQASLAVGLDLVLFIVAVMGGRVIPMFTNNGVPGTKAERRPWLEKLALGSLIVLTVADLAAAPAAAVGAVAALAAAAHALRLALWQPWRTLRTPLVWVLHAAYAWIVVHLALRAGGAFGLPAGTLATHALTIGVIGGMTIGMMTRTARGHTGRPLVADGYEVACYVLVLVAALVRVFGPTIVPAHYVATVVVAGACWSLAFALYVVRYWPVLSRPRLDGKPG
ncbi:MAG: hypothetical protein BroJett026_21260 [Betaproteobacteria bacterium]|nr:MAG: hypothetical protein BroJett026_21260 [Betaproteobacteria bacterium]